MNALAYLEATNTEERAPLTRTEALTELAQLMRRLDEVKGEGKAARESSRAIGERVTETFARLGDAYTALCVGADMLRAVYIKFQGVPTKRRELVDNRKASFERAITRAFFTPLEGYNDNGQPVWGSPTHKVTISGRAGAYVGSAAPITDEDRERAAIRAFANAVKAAREAELSPALILNTAQDVLSGAQDVPEDIESILDIL